MSGYVCLCSYIYYVIRKNVNRGCERGESVDESGMRAVWEYVDFPHMSLALLEAFDQGPCHAQTIGCGTHDATRVACPLAAGPEARRGEGLQPLAAGHPHR